MKARHLWKTSFLLAFSLILVLPSATWANPNTGPPTNLHRRFVVKQTKRKASQGKSTRRNVGVWISGGYGRTVAKARRGGSRFRRW